LIFSVNVAYYTDITINLEIDRASLYSRIKPLKTTVQYFTDKGSSVFIAALDISKAFDRVHHFKLFNSLLSAGIPVVIVDVLCNWYSVILYCQME